jgi:hypothetical protein
MRLLEDGYVPRLTEWPPSSYIQNNASARDPENVQFIDEEVARLHQTGAVEMVDRQPWIVSPLQVCKREGKKSRLIQDVSRQVNGYIVVDSVKLITLEKINENANVGDYFATTDMSSGYHHLKINEEYKELFGFCWRGQFYRWKCAFLGLKDLVLEFTKFVAPILAYARTHGHAASGYLDDLHVLAGSFEKCERGIVFLQDVMRKAGIVEAVQKFQPPTRRGVFLGLINNLEDLTYEIPPEKMAGILAKLSEFLKAETVRVPTREVASLYGKIAACRLATGPIMRLHTRSGQKYYSEDGRKDWDGSTDLTPFKDELARLLFLLPTLSKYNMFGKEVVAAVDKIVASDASGVGFGLVKVNCGAQKEHVDHEGPCSKFLDKRFFTPQERRGSSSLRELIALEDAYANGALDGLGRSILHLTDSAPVEAIMRIGSPIPELQRRALAIHMACRA